MKLIIDIDDEMVCNDIKNKALEPTSETDKVIINALYNGTPVSNEGDLISREALKKALEDYEAYSDIIPKEVYDFIDNAPTVEPRIEYGTDGQPYILSITNGIEERPQGEWTDDNEENKYPLLEQGWKCSICGTRQTYGKTPFCAWCGTDMRGDKE